MKSDQELRDDLNTLYALSVPDATLVHLRGALAHLRAIKEYPAIVRSELAHSLRVIERAVAKITYYQGRLRQ